MKKELRRRKIRYLSQFIDDDIARCLEEIVEKAVEEKIRDNTRLQGLAQEAALNISQLLLNAKKEFSPEEGDPKVREAMLDKLHFCEEAYSLEHLLEELHRRLGIALIDRTRGALQRELSHCVAQSHQDGKKEKWIAELIERSERRLREANEEAQKSFDRPELVMQVQEELHELAILYTNPEMLENRFSV